MKNKKKFFLLFIFISLSIFLLSFTLALTNYDQRVYKVSSTYSSSLTPSTQSIRAYEGYEELSKPSYTYSGMEDTRRGFLGDYVKEYSVYVTNQGRIGSYYKVTFELRDMYGYEFSQSVTKYLRSSERKKFVYRDIQYERNEIIDWSYKITAVR